MPNSPTIASLAVITLPRRARTPGPFRFVDPNAILRLFEAGVHAIEIVRLSVMRLSGSNGDVLLRTGFKQAAQVCVVDNRERRSWHLASFLGLQRIIQS